MPNTNNTTINTNKYNNPPLQIPLIELYINVCCSLNTHKTLFSRTKHPRPVHIETNHDIIYIHIHTFINISIY